MRMSGGKIPRCMSTQHPDNVNLPFFSTDTELGGEDEIQEAYYVFSHLGCDEQMWDFEGKEVDSHVVKKLLTKYDQYFKRTILGRDKFLTFRVPNPDVEKAEGKILLETLESIPRSFDAARLFYNKEIAPVFEIIMPMTSSVESLNRIYKYYVDFVIGKQRKTLLSNDITIKDWIGEFKPEKINIIPLFEDWKNMLDADKITEKYLKDKKVDRQRVFLARSDPAMNYGLITAVLLNKIALYRLYKLSKKIGIELYPIIGVGSAPFRGNLKPSTTVQVINEYPSVYTFTIQSSFKYDHTPDEVITSLKKIYKWNPIPPDEVEEKKCIEICIKYVKEYQRQIIALAPLINAVAKYIPSRRKRKLHIGLFGYSRDIEGLKLPRAISFTAALYTVGIPPEILGLNALNNNDVHFVKRYYKNFEKDLSDALAYINVESSFLPQEIKNFLKKMDFVFRINKEYQNISRKIIDALDKNLNCSDLVIQSASLRNFLG